MIVFGVTGGVGAGKSTVLDYLRERWKAEILKMDETGHEVMEPGQDCYREIVAAFGSGILADDGTIDRKQLGEIVFQDHGKLEILNGIVHPAVKRAVFEAIERAEQSGTELFALESALLFSESYDAICGEVWYIYADEAVRVRRIAADRGYSMERIRGILASQEPDSFFRDRCQVIIENNGDRRETEAQIDAAVRRLQVPRGCTVL